MSFFFLSITGHYHLKNEVIGVSPAGKKQHDGASTQRINQNTTKTETWENPKKKKTQFKKRKKDAEGGEKARIYVHRQHF